MLAFINQWQALCLIGAFIFTFPSTWLLTQDLSQRHFSVVWSLSLFVGSFFQDLAEETTWPEGHRDTVGNVISTLLWDSQCLVSRCIFSCALRHDQTLVTCPVWTGRRRLNPADWNHPGVFFWRSCVWSRHCPRMDISAAKNTKIKNDEPWLRR